MVKLFFSFGCEEFAVVSSNVFPFFFNGWDIGAKHSNALFQSSLKQETLN